MSILDLYIARRVSSAFLIALFTIGAMIGLIDFVEVSRTIGARTDVRFADLLVLTGLKLPSTLVSLLPFMVLFGTMGAYVSLNRSSELVVMRAAGISAWRFVLPAMLVAGLIGGLTTVALAPGAALAKSGFNAFESRLLKRHAGGAHAPIWLRQNDGNQEMVIRAADKAVEAGMLSLQQVTVFLYQRDPDRRLRFVRAISADQARLEAGFWRLAGVRESAPGTGAIRSESLSLPSTLDSQSAVERLMDTPSVPIWRLPSRIRQTESAGVSGLGLRIRLQQLTATPLLFMAMAILACAFSLRMVRRGGVAVLSAAGILLGFVIFFTSQFSMALARADALPVLLATWGPASLALLSGMALLLYTEDG